MLLHKFLDIKLNFIYIFILLIPVLVLLAAKWIRGRMGSREKGGEGRLCKLYNIRDIDYSVIDKLAKFMEDRGRRGLARYIASSYYSSSARSSFIVICGVRGLLEREVEVFESFLNVFEGLKVEPAGYVIDTFSTQLELRSTPQGWAGLVLPASRPVSMASDGGILLGERLDTPLPEPVYLFHRDIGGHVGVFGSTGAGKSTTIRAISERLAKIGYRVLVLDWAGEHRIPGFKRIDPSRGDLPLDPIRSIRDPGIVVDIMSHALGLTDPQAYMLQQLLSTHGPSNVKELVALLDEIPEEAKWDREVKRALARKLWPIASGGPAFDASKEPGRIPRASVIIDLSRIGSLRARRAYALTLLALLYKEAHEPGFARTVIVIDEAHNLLSAESTLVEEILSEARKYGLYIVYATQSPSILNARLINNTNTKIVHRLTSRQDKEYIERSITAIPIPLDKLAPGEAILQSVSYPEPVLVKVEPGGYSRDELADSGVAKPVDTDPRIP